MRLGLGLRMVIAVRVAFRGVSWTAVPPRAPQHQVSVWVDINTRAQLRIVCMKGALHHLRCVGGSGRSAKAAALLHLGMPIPGAHQPWLSHLPQGQASRNDLWTCTRGMAPRRVYVQNRDDGSTHTCL